MQLFSLHLNCGCFMLKEDEEEEEAEEEEEMRFFFSCFTRNFKM